MPQVYRLTESNILDGAGGPNPPSAWHPVFGAAVTTVPYTGRNQAQEFAQHETECGKMGVYRHYDGNAGMPSSWSSTAGGAATYAGWEDRWTWTSVKPTAANVISGALDGAIDSWLASIPAAKTGIKRLITCWHEPEAKVPGTFSVDQWKQCAYRFGQRVQAAGRSDLLYGPIFMSRFTFDTINQLWNSTAAGDLNDVIDFVGWDPYNEGSSHNDWSAPYQGATGVSYYWDDLTVWTQQHAPGKHICIGETGFIPQPSNLQQKVDWINAMEQYAIDQRFLAVCWFDANVATEPFWWLRRYATTPGDDTTLTVDTPAINAWSGVYSRHPLTYQGWTGA